MFTKIRAYFDFRGFVKKARVKHEESAERIYDTSSLEQELQRRQKHIQQLINSKYDLDINNASTLAQAQSDKLMDKKQQLSYFQTDYSQQIDRLYADMDDYSNQLSKITDQISELGAEIKEAHEQKDDLYEIMRGSKRDHYAEYSEIEDLKEEIYDLKERRSAAYDERAKLKDYKSLTYDEIQNLKARRQNMFDLKKAGITPEKIRADISKISEYHRIAAQEVRQLNDAKNSEKLKLSLENDLDTFEARIGRIISEKKEFIDSFTSSLHQEQLKKDHRIHWNANHKHKI